MGKKTQAAEPAGAAVMEFEAETLYRVRVGRTCQAANVDFSPANTYKVKGKVAAQIREFLVEAVALDEAAPDA